MRENRDSQNNQELELSQDHPTTRPGHLLPSYPHLPPHLPQHHLHHQLALDQQHRRQDLIGVQCVRPVTRHTTRTAVMAGIESGDTDTETKDTAAVADTTCLNHVIEATIIIIIIAITVRTI